MVVFITLFGSTTAAVGMQESREDKETYVRSVCEAYRANRASFRYFKCRYVLTRAVAESFDAAIEGEITVAQSAAGEWVVDGSKQRCSIETDETILRELVHERLQQAEVESGGTDIQLPGFFSKHFVGDEDVQLGFARFLNTGTLYSGTHGNQTTNFCKTPWSIHGYSSTPAELIERHLADGGRYLVGSREGEPSELVVIKLFEPLGAAGKTVQYVFDPARGYLPVEIKKEWEQGSSVISMTDTWPCSGGRWFPKRIVEAPRLCDDCVTFQLEVLELDVDQRPSAADFEVEFAKGTEFVERSSPHAYFHLERPQAIGPSDLPNLVDRAMTNWEKHKAENGRKELAKAASGGGESRWWLAIGSVVVLLSVATFVVVQRYRSARDSASNE